MTEFAEQDKAKVDTAKKTLEEQAEKSKDAVEMNNKRMFNSRPTPTQEEANLSALGVPIKRHDDDGSGGEYIRETVIKQAEAKPNSGAPYSTRAANPAPASAQHRQHRAET